jgi:hypothetical protein
MSGWHEENLLKFMQINSDVFGEDMRHIKDADEIWKIERFIKGLFHALDCMQVICTPYVDIKYCGKGDIESVRVKKDFSLTLKQCAEIADFVACRFVKGNLNQLDSFAVLNYIKNGVYLRTDYIGMLQKMFEKTKGGGE